MQNKLEQYTSVHISTVDRGRLLLLMYDGAIRFLKQAKAGLEENNVPKFCRFLSKSQAVIAELQNTLDHQKGGEIAKDLDRLYDFMLFYLTEANLQKDANKLQRVINLLETISGAYREIIEGGKIDLSTLDNDAAIARAPQAPTPNPVKEDEAEKLPGQMLRVSF